MKRGREIRAQAEGSSSTTGSSVGGASEESEFRKIPLNLYSTGTPVTFDIYFYYQRQFILFKSKDSQWSLEDSNKLKAAHTSDLYAKFKSMSEHHDFLHSQMKSILKREDVATERKAKVLREISGPIMESIYKSPDSSEVISSAAELAHSCIDYITERGSLPELFKLSSESLTEHTHALHTAAYSVALAHKMGVTDKAQKFALGLGALLHDVGKTRIDRKILEKPEELNDQEWQIMRQHPEMGEQILYHRQIVPALSRRIVLEHHERSNGKGYPRGVRSIHSFSQIVSVADCFNSLTCDRPWAKGMTPYEALKFMIHEMRSEFDPDVMTNFIAMLSK